MRRSDQHSGDKLTIDHMTFDFGKMDFRSHNQAVILSKMEQKLLKILVMNKGNILTREQLMDKIWTQDAEFVDENALTVTIRRLRSKLEDEPSSPKYIKTVYGLGYIWVGGSAHE
ncbi:winged helix-turn-helix domain-containing protein [Paenibacillus sp. IHBB 10380]|uniref:winged helix-turn-helix domain-containing protein n=1 Tax=Paenibacillus sp. IHBB 10380 TaxID=1566358 RepID=UPI002D21B12D|nr:helix-turn-helix domain-containing protein [Paenibacillus sp. IHBB 10380]